MKIKKSIIKKSATFAVIALFLLTAITSATNINKTSKNNIEKQNFSQNLFKSDSKAFILTIEPYYSDSSFSVIDIDDTDIIETDISSTHGDDEIKYYNGKIYILNRCGYDYIEVFDTQNNYEKILEFSTGTGSNPQDIAFISEDKAYVSCYDTTDLLIVNPTTGEHLGTIDLSEYADDDGIPEMHKMVSFKFFRKSRVYLTIQRLDRENWFEPTDKSYIIEIDGDQDTIIRAIQLSQVNPSTAPILDGPRILVGETGSWYDDEDGGIESINIFTNKAEGFIISEADLGGNIVDFDIYKTYNRLRGLFLFFLDNVLGIKLFTRNIYSIVSDLSYNTKLVSYNLKDNSHMELYSTEGYQLADLKINDKGEVYIADRNEIEPGIIIFDVESGDQKTNNPIDVGSYPPVHITFF